MLAAWLPAAAALTAGSSTAVVEPLFEPRVVDVKVEGVSLERVDVSMQIAVRASRNVTIRTLTFSDGAIRLPGSMPRIAGVGRAHDRRVVAGDLRGRQAACWLAPRSRHGVPAESGRRPRRPNADRSEGRRLCGAHSRLSRRDPDESGWQRLPRRRLGAGGQRNRRPRLFAVQRVPLPPRRRSLRAGDGLLLDYRSAEVHPEPRLRHLQAAGQPEVAERPHQPMGRRQLVRHHAQGRTALRQGRRGRCRGRGGHPP